MGHREARLVGDLGPGQQDVEIAGARAVANAADAPELLLHGEQAGQEIAQRKVA